MKVIDSYFQIATIIYYETQQPISMNIFDYLAIILLTVLGGALLGFLLQPFINEVLRLIMRGKDVSNLWRLKKRSTTLSSVDRLIANKNFEMALREIKKDLGLHDLHSLKEITIIKEHHQNILSRIIVIAEELDSRPTNISHLERLFIQWADLSRSRIKTIESFSNINSRRSSSGKTTPLWGRNIFTSATKEIDSALKFNRLELEQELDKLIKELLAKKSSFYH